MKNFFLDNYSRVILQALFILFSLLIAVYFGPYIEMSKFEPVLSTLQNVSAAVFTLAGIWIAYSYPEAIASFTDPQKINIIKGTDNYKRIKSLVLTIFASSFVLILISILLINITRPIIEVFNLPAENIIPFKCGYLGFVIYIVLVQLYAISKIMISNFSFVYNIGKKKTEREIEDDLSQ